MHRHFRKEHAVRRVNDFNKAILYFFLLFALPVSVMAADASEGQGRPRLGGPDQVENQLQSDRAEKDTLFDLRFLDPYFEWQAQLKEKHGFAIGVDYTAAYLTANESLADTEDKASSGIARLYGSWELAGRGTDSTGALVYKVEHRHAYGDLAPNGFSLGSLGNVGVIEPPFSDQGTRLTNLYWRQRWSGGKFVGLAGFLDATDFLDIFALGSPWLHFMNFTFSTGAASISLPEDATLGLAAAAWLNDKTYLIGSLTDTNSDPTDPFEGFDTFFNEHEYFKSVEIGYTTAQDRAYLDNIHLTLWHTDEREEAGVPDGWGAVFSYTQFFNNNLMPFFRAGYAEDGGSLLQRSVSGGIGYRPKVRTEAPGDLIGFGVNWGRPNEASFGPGLDDQAVVELFYRLQLSRELAVTADVQYLKDPALNPTEDSIWLLGLRGRLAL